MTTEANSNFTLKPNVIHLGLSVSQPVSSVKNPKANAILEQVHQVIATLLCITELDMSNTVVTSDINAFLADAAWTVCSTYHTVLKASPGATIFGQEMLFDIPFLADRNKIGDHRQRQRDLNTERENCSCLD